MPKRKTQTISAILMGDHLGALVDELNGLSTTDKLIILLIEDTSQVITRRTPNVNKLEAIGVLQLALNDLLNE